MAAFKTIKTQADLNKVMEKEEGKFYISLNGQVAMFESKYILSALEVQDRAFQIAAGMSEAIVDSIADDNKKDLEEALEISLRTYVLPFRIH